MSRFGSWKERLAQDIPEDWGREIDAFEGSFALRRQGKIDEKSFADGRLRRGVYGQRYDNGQRHDGATLRTLAYPSGTLTKGPGTLWDAPGMHRIRLPLGRLTPQQLEVIAELSEEFANGILHVTTRQNIQLDFVHIEDTPDLLRRLAAAGISSQDISGNVVRTVTACVMAGVCPGESFDTTPHAMALTGFLLGHPDTRGFGRKLKFSFSGCEDGACGLAKIQDLGLVARTRVADGQRVRGFGVYVGGGLGAVPQEAQVLSEFIPEAELLPLAQALCRVFARLGEKENRARARLKFLVKHLGIEEFTRLVLEERAQLVPDPRWTAHLGELARYDESPASPPSALGSSPWPEGFAEWQHASVQPQRQEGYSTVQIRLPLGDFSVAQARKLAELGRRFAGNAFRTTADQNLAFRWVAEGELPALYEELQALGLAAVGVGPIADITACPGTETCKLGLSSSRGLARELRRRLQVAGPALAPEVGGLHLKCSGCFNSCARHALADIGFLGINRTVEGRRVPHVQLVLGGESRGNGGSFGQIIGALPTRRAPDLVEAILKRFSADRLPEESFHSWVGRLGKKELRPLVDSLAAVPSYADDPSFYSDWGDPRELVVGDAEGAEAAPPVDSAPFTSPSARGGAPGEGRAGRRLQVTLRLPAGKLDPEGVLAVFHRWIRERVIVDVLIDVVDYRHVFGGPGPVLIGHQGDYSLNAGPTEAGLSYVLKRWDGPSEQWIAESFRRLLRAAQLLEEELASGGAEPLGGDIFEIRVLDRLLSPVTGQAQDALRSELETLSRGLFSGTFVQIESTGTAKEPLSFLLRGTPRPLALALQSIESLTKIGTSPA